jgi:hypothetical protein
MASNLLTPPTYGKLQFLEDPSESPSTKKCSTHTPEEIALPFLEKIYISELFLPSSIGLAIARPDSRPGYTDCRIRTSGSTFAPISLFHYSKTTYRSDWILLFRRLFRLPRLYLRFTYLGKTADASLATPRVNSNTILL